jgi:hypothetical protein
MDWHWVSEKQCTLTVDGRMLTVNELGPNFNDEGRGVFFRVSGIGYEFADHATLDEAQAAAEAWLKAPSD